MNQSTFNNLASDSLLFAQGRAYALGVKQSQVDLWTLQARVSLARSTI